MIELQWVHSFFLLTISLLLFLLIRRGVRFENAMHSRLSNLSDRLFETNRKIDILSEKQDKIRAELVAVAQEMDSFSQEVCAVLDRNSHSMRGLAAVLKDEIDEIETLDRRVIELEYKAPPKTPQEMAQEQHEAKRVKLRRMRRTLGSDE